jgi:hypothetical protein
MFPRTLVSPVLHLGQLVALQIVVAEETCVSRELKKPRDRGGSLSGHNNDEAAFCQMITGRGKRLPSGLAIVSPDQGDGG